MFSKHAEGARSRCWAHQCSTTQEALLLPRPLPDEDDQVLGLSDETLQGLMPLLPCPVKPLCPRLTSETRANSCVRPKRGSSFRDFVTPAPSHLYNRRVWTMGTLVTLAPCWGQGLEVFEGPASPSLICVLFTLSSA